MEKGKKKAWFALLDLISDPEWEEKPEKVTQWRALMSIIDPELKLQNDVYTRSEGVLAARPGLENEILSRIKQGMDKKLIKDELNTTLAIVAHVRKKHRVGRINARKKLSIDKRTLEKEYSSLGLIGVCEKYAVSDDSVYERMREFGIKRRSTKPTPVYVIYSDGSKKTFSSLRKAAAATNITVAKVWNCIHYKTNDPHGNRYALTD
ncbi:hypothetical protein [Enterococcus sp. DIV0800]|uniref:hypothetical protein n=1 Tax=unclassified Enterococcus TaxID=2608891 RepID=UPI003D2FC06C